MIKPQRTCHYLDYCEYSSTKIYELVNELLGEEHSADDRIRRALAEELENWAKAHIDLKSAITTMDGLYDNCSPYINEHRAKLSEIAAARESGVTIEQLEKLLLDWFEHLFVTGEERCADCEYEQHNQQNATHSPN